jgi:hypothetical protein
MSETETAEIPMIEGRKTSKPRKRDPQSIKSLSTTTVILVSAPTEVIKRWRKVPRLLKGRLLHMMVDDLKAKRIKPFDARAIWAARGWLDMQTYQLHITDPEAAAVLFSYYSSNADAGRALMQYGIDYMEKKRAELVERLRGRCMLAQAVIDIVKEWWPWYSEPELKNIAKEFLHDLINSGLIHRVGPFPFYLYCGESPQELIFYYGGRKTKITAEMLKTIICQHISTCVSKTCRVPIATITYELFGATPMYIMTSIATFAETIGLHVEDLDRSSRKKVIVAQRELC